MNTKKLYEYIDEPIDSLPIHELIYRVEGAMHSKYISRYEAALDLEQVPVNIDTKIKLD